MSNITHSISDNDLDQVGQKNLTNTIDQDVIFYIFKGCLKYKNSYFLLIFKFIECKDESFTSEDNLHENSSEKVIQLFK